MKKLLILIIIALSLVTAFTSCEEQSKNEPSSSQKQEEEVILYRYRHDPGTVFLLGTEGYSFINMGNARIEAYRFKNGVLELPPIYKDHECTKPFHSIQEVFAVEFFYLNANEGVIRFDFEGTTK